MALVTHLDHSDRSSVAGTAPVPLDKFATDAADSKQPDPFSLQPPDLAVCSLDIALVQIQIGLRKCRLMRKDEV